MKTVLAYFMGWTFLLTMIFTTLYGYFYDWGEYIGERYSAILGIGFAILIVLQYKRKLR